MKSTICCGKGCEGPRYKKSGYCQEHLRERNKAYVCSGTSCAREGCYAEKFNNKSSYCRGHLKEYNRDYNKRHHERSKSNTHSVFTITNLKTNKTFYGITNSLKRRWISQKAQAFDPKGKLHHLKLHQDMRELGIENFKFEEFMSGLVSKKQAMAVCKYFIQRSQGNCYNVKHGPKNNICAVPTCTEPKYKSNSKCQQHNSEYLAEYYAKSRQCCHNRCKEMKTSTNARCEKHQKEYNRKYYKEHKERAHELYQLRKTRGK